MNPRFRKLADQAATAFLWFLLTLLWFVMARPYLVSQQIPVVVKNGVKMYSPQYPFDNLNVQSCAGCGSTAITGLTAGCLPQAGGSALINQCSPFVYNGQYLANSKPDYSTTLDSPLINENGVHATHRSSTSFSFTESSSNPYPGYADRASTVRIFGPGNDAEGSGTSYQGSTLAFADNVTGIYFSRGIASHIQQSATKYAAGDFQLHSEFMAYYGGCWQSSCEGVEGGRISIQQLPYTAGIITGGASTGSSLITVNLTSGAVFNDESTLLWMPAGGGELTGTLTSPISGGGGAIATYATLTSSSRLRHRPHGVRSYRLRAPCGLTPFLRL